MTLKILVRGSGDVASAVAHQLYGAGYKVVMHDAAFPAATRRTMAFCDAIFDGQATLAGVRAKLCANISELIAALDAHALIPVSTANLLELLPMLQPQVLVDARMRKHHQPEAQMALAPFTVGLGPNFVAGHTVHAAVETGWGGSLGQVIWEGAPRALAGEPQTIAGHARDRYVYAPAAGVFRTSCRIGDRVTAGQALARIGDTLLHAPISGRLRGLTHDGVPVSEKTKVIEVDPRGEAAVLEGIAERPGRIARGVLEAIAHWERDRESA